MQLQKNTYPIPPTSALSLDLGHLANDGPDEIGMLLRRRGHRSGSSRRACSARRSIITRALRRSLRGIGVLRGGLGRQIGRARRAQAGRGCHPP